MEKERGANGIPLVGPVVKDLESLAAKYGIEL
jgi:hypothetical protein